MFKDLLLVLCSGITPDFARDPHAVCGSPTGVDYTRQDTSCPISLAFSQVTVNLGSPEFNLPQESKLFHILFLHFFNTWFHFMIQIDFLCSNHGVHIPVNRMDKMMTKDIFLTLEEVDLIPHWSDFHHMVIASCKGSWEM